MTKKIVQIISLLAILSGAFLTIEAIKKPDIQPEDKIVLEDAYIVSRQDIATYTEIEGTVVAQDEQSTTQTAGISGKITDIAVSEGDNINLGDIVANVTIGKTSQTAISQAKALVDKAQADLNAAKNSPDTQTVQYWDQAVVDVAEAHLAKVITDSNKAVEDAQTRVDALSGQSTSPINTESKNQVRADLIEAFYNLDQSLWNYDQVKSNYFVRNDQWSYRVQEKLTDAMAPYYSANWYIENYILDDAQDWAITDCLNFTVDSLKKLTTAYVTLAEAMKDPVYIAVINNEDRGVFENGRSRATLAYAKALGTKILWEGSDEPVTITGVSLEEAQAKLESTQKRALDDIASADQALKNAYATALKTKTVSIPKNTAALEAALNSARNTYNELLSGKSTTYELRAQANGIISDVYVTKNAWLDASSNILTITTKTGLVVEAETSENVDLFSEVEIVSGEENLKGAVTNVAEKEVQISFENCNDICLEEGNNVTIKITITEKKNALAIPKGYLITQDNEDFVEIEVDGEIVLKEVTTGLINGELVEILEGLEQGNTIYLPKK